MFEIAQYPIGSVEDYSKVSSNAIEVLMKTTRLATALTLARVHGVQFAAAYLYEAGVSIDVAVELLATDRSTRQSCDGQNGAQNALPREVELTKNYGRVRLLRGGNGQS